MPRIVTLVLSLSLLVAACGSDDDATSSSSSSSGGAASCPNVAGTWKVTAHCEASLVGMSAVVTQNGCALGFAAPFNGFSGTVTADSKVSLSGPQTCNGTVSASAMSMTCTPGTCAVTLSR